MATSKLVRSLAFCKGLIFLVLFAATAFAQTGVQPGEETVGSVVLDNLNIALNIPLISKPGVGLSFNYGLSYNSNLYHVAVIPGPPVTKFWTPNSQSKMGWESNTFDIIGTVPYSVSNGCALYTIYTAPSGTTYNLALNTAHVTPKVCSSTTVSSWTMTDGSGLTLTVGPNYVPRIISSSGVQVNSTTTSVTGINCTQCIQDTNGNTIKMGSSTTAIDTLGVTQATLSTNGSTTNVTYPVTGLQSPQIGITTTSLSIKTAFNCSGVGEFSGTRSLVTQIQLGDGSAYHFQYEFTPGSSTTYTGRLAGITLPTGGQINYTYGTYDCTNGLMSLTKTTQDGSWRYTRSVSGAVTTTVVGPAPANNTSVYKFVYAVYTVDGTQTTSPNAFEIDRKVYQGAATGTPLEEVATCYNAVTTGCASVAAGSISFPITQKNVYTTLGGMASSSRTQIQFDAYNNPTYEAVYDFGTSTPTRQIVTPIGTWNGTTCASVGSNINNRTCYRNVYDGSNNILASEVFTYDSHGNRLSHSASPTANIFNPGNLTTSATYNPNGTVATSTDMNSAQSNYSYTNCGNGNGFYEGGTYPQGLSISGDAWDCNGGVNTTSNDVNGNSTTSAFNDPLFRTTQVTDPLSNSTSVAYTSTTSEASMAFNANASISDVLTTVDSLGRASKSQHKQAFGSASYDTVVNTYAYDATGLKTTVSQPCVTTAGGGCTTPVTTQTRDALGRPLVTTDGGGNTVVTKQYTGRDVKITVSAPAGESAKVVQQEFNGLGQLISLCRISSASGSGPCSQDLGGTGFVTQYNYNPSGTLASVVYNNQSATKQTHSFTYDNLGRKLTETHPESGQTTYTYDSETGCGGSSTSAGDLVLITRNDGHVQCLFYDALHRLVGKEGTSDDTPQNPAVDIFYDSATSDPGNQQPAPTGFPANPNAKGRVIEAETRYVTSRSPFTTQLLTDEWFAYDADGRLTDTWEKTPNSGGYYHNTASYFANGAISGITALGGISAAAYTVDGEGRLKGMTSGGNTVVSAVGYDAGSRPTGITYQAGSDTYQYDPNTGRMTLYKYTINSASMQGSLTWNPNGTLKQLAITDGFFAAGTQTCNNTYNELAQLVSNNCGSVWSQTFTYDPFNNITKSGSSQWMPGYSQTNNRYQNGATYDANGNLLYDTFNSYTWNDFNKPLTIVAGNSTPTCGTSGTCITYDAFDRAVELNVSGTFSQMYYGPANKGLMSGTTANQERVPLPGMGTYNQINGAFGHIWHSDWLGTSRFAATRAGTVIFDRAFAPYGEMYAANTGGTTEKSFTGDTQDTFAGLFDTPARELHPTQGRWISPDPAHAGMNAYAYTTNPLSMSDPTGLFNGLDQFDLIGAEQANVNAGPSTMVFDIQFVKEPEKQNVSELALDYLTDVSGDVDPTNTQTGPLGSDGPVFSTTVPTDYSGGQSSTQDDPYTLSLGTGVAFPASIQDGYPSWAEAISKAFDGQTLSQADVEVARRALSVAGMGMGDAEALNAFQEFNTHYQRLFQPSQQLNLFEGEDLANSVRQLKTVGDGDIGPYTLLKATMEKDPMWLNEFQNMVESIVPRGNGQINLDFTSHPFFETPFFPESFWGW